MSSFTFSDEEILRRVGETVEAKLRGGNLTPIAMRLSRGFLSLVSRAPLVASDPPQSPLTPCFLMRVRRSCRG